MATRDSVGALSSSIKGAGYLFLLQLSSRAATFLLNNLVQRVSSIQTVGIASDLELLSGTVLFLSRENLRMALLRSTETDAPNVSDPPTKGEVDINANGMVGGNLRKRKTGNAVPKASEEYVGGNAMQQQKLINLSYLPMLVGVFLVAAFLCYHYTVPTHGRPMGALWVYLLAAIVELGSEPMYILCQSRFLYDVRAKVEGTALLVRCVTTFALTMTMPSLKSASVFGLKMGSAEAYAWGQLAYAMFLIFGYVGALKSQSVMSRLSSSTESSSAGLSHLLRPCKIREITRHGKTTLFYLDPYLLSVAGSFTAQSALKYMLTEGDRILLMWMGRNNDEKGAYKMVSDLGSLIARIVFQPLEETARAFFSRTLSNPTGVRKETLTTSMDLLSTLIRFHLCLGTYFVFFATNYSGTLISILYGNTKASTPDIVLALSIYCLYVPIMGINGITEAFLQGVGDSHTIKKQSYWLVVCSAVFALVAYVTMNLFTMGPGGLVVANIANMIMRIYFCWHFIRDFYLQPRRWEHPTDVKRSLSVKEMIPGDGKVYATLVVSWIVTYIFPWLYGWDTWKSKILHILLGGTCAFVTSVLMYESERQKLFGKLREYYRKAKSAEED
ncbi:hypothetical protein SpCBS45565_g03018 [Spizellomyces sp. 'palustris']|nr:hypothetical protein SpCBS45565_g03018 [Spizellomyces sp. 'palustris']